MQKYAKILCCFYFCFCLIFLASFSTLGFAYEQDTMPEESFWAEENLDDNEGISSEFEDRNFLDVEDDEDEESFDYQQNYLTEFD